MLDLRDATCDTYPPHSPCKLLLLQYFRWAHNPKVVGSNPTPATPLSPCQSGAYLFLGAFRHLPTESHIILYILYLRHAYAITQYMLDARVL